MNLSPSPDDYVVRAEGVAKRYGPIVALRDTTLRLKRGEILGLIGDNGAGKSTLIKILTGFQQPDEGALFVDGEEVKLRSVSHARELGIETVYQDLALIDQLPVYLNMNLNKEAVHRPIPFLNKRRMRAESRAHLADMGVRIPSVETDVGFLSGGQRQAVAIARAVYSDAKVILLDEPLAAMGSKESTIIIDLILELKQRGDVSMILIAHNFAQVVEVCDRVALLQHGRITYEKPVGETSVLELTELVSAEYRGRGQPDTQGL